MKWTVSIGALLVLVFIPNYNASEPTGEMAFLFQLTTEDDSSPGDFLLTSEDATLHPPDDRLLETTTGNICNVLICLLWF